MSKTFGFFFFQIYFFHLDCSFLVVIIIFIIIIIIITIDSSKRQTFAKVSNSLPEDIRNISDRGCSIRRKNHYFNTVTKDRQLFIYLHNSIF